jgi:hypothetical protein
MNNYLIPANSKKSQLILGLFNMGDLIVFLSGVSITVALLIVFKTNSMAMLLGFASPALLATFLVAPVPNYHNVMTLIGNVINFATGQKKYYWRGWCASYDSNRPKRDGGSSF